MFDKVVGSKILRTWRHMSAFTAFPGLSVVFVGISLSVQANVCVDG